MMSLLNPASAFVKAAMVIYDIVMFFINSGSQIMDLVNSIVDAVGAIANNAVGCAAKLAKSLPVVIGFLASFNFNVKMARILSKNNFLWKPKLKIINWIAN